MKDENGGTGSFSDNKFCPLSAVVGGDLEGLGNPDVSEFLKVLTFICIYLLLFFFENF